MKASEKLRALREHEAYGRPVIRRVAEEALFDALPQIVAVVEAAAEVARVEATGVLPDFQPLADALAALDEALTPQDGGER